MTSEHSELYAQVGSLAAAVGGVLLSIDTSSLHASVCVAAPTQNGVPQVHESLLPANSLPSNHLADAIQTALHAVNSRITDLAGIVVSLGPGSFTGLRVGMATVKGMAMAGNIPLYGVSSLAVLAASADLPGHVAPVVNAYQGEIFAAVYQSTGADKIPSTSLPLTSSAVVADSLHTTATWQITAQEFSSHIQYVTYVGDTVANKFANGFSPKAACAIMPRALWGLLLSAQDLIEGKSLPSMVVPKYLSLSAPERLLQNV